VANADSGRTSAVALRVWLAPLHPYRRHGCRGQVGQGEPRGHYRSSTPNPIWGESLRVARQSTEAQCYARFFRPGHKGRRKDLGRRSNPFEERGSCTPTDFKRPEVSSADWTKCRPDHHHWLIHGEGARFSRSGSRALGCAEAAERGCSRSAYHLCRCRRYDRNADSGYIVLPFRTARPGATK